MTLALDDTDRAILHELVADAGLGAGELGRRLGLSQPATWRRIRRLEEAGVIRGRRVEVDRAALGFGVTVFLGIKLATKGRVSLEDFERAATASTISRFWPCRQLTWRREAVCGKLRSQAGAPASLRHSRPRLAVRGPNTP